MTDNYKNTKVHLSEYEVWMVKEHARKNVEAGKKVNGSAHNYTDKTDLQLMELGIGGEWAYCKIFNLFPQIVFAPGGHCDAIHNLWRIDVKSQNKGEESVLRVKNMPHVHTDIVDWYALMIGTLPEYYLGGWMKASDLIVDAHFHEYKPRDNPDYDFLAPSYDCYVAWQHELVGLLPMKGE